MFHKKRLLFGLLILLAVIVLVWFLIPKKTTNQEGTALLTPTPVSVNRQITPIPPSSSYQFSSFQKTVIGKTPEQEIALLKAVLKKETIAGDQTRYTLLSVNPQQDDEIITKNGVVVFEKTSTFTNNDGGFPKFSPIKNLYGKEEMALQGHPYYGPFAVTYIFAYRGFAVVVNPNTDNIYEVQRFTPLSIDSYLKIYGSNLSLTPPQPRPEDQ